MNETPQSKSKIILLVVVLFLVGILAAWWFVSQKIVSPADRGTVPSASKNPPSPPPKRNIPLAGNVLSITPEKREITIGIYKVENNKAVLADQHIVQYTRETSFVRQGIAGGGKTAITKISDRDVKIGDTVFITPTTERLGGQIVAAEVNLINPPPPPRR